MRKENSVTFSPPGGIKKTVNSCQELIDSGIVIHPEWVENMWGAEAKEKYIQSRAEKIREENASK